MKISTIILSLLLFVNVSCQKDIEPDYVINPKDYETVTTATDIRLQYKIPFNGVFNQGQTKDITLRIREVAGMSTSGQIVIIIPPKAGFTFSFDPTKTSGTNPVGPVDNGLFSSIGYPQGSLFIYTSSTIVANGEFKIAIDITASGTGSGINAIFNSILLPGSGGDSININNEANINIVIL